jgi:hypothetical protein
MIQRSSEFGQPNAKVAKVAQKSQKEFMKDFSLPFATFA